MVAGGFNRGGESERGPVEGEARQKIIDARRLLRAEQPETERVDSLLGEAISALSRSECRLDRPYAEIIQVGDGSGIHYECTHNPSHRFAG